MTRICLSDQLGVDFLSKQGKVITLLHYQKLTVNLKFQQLSNLFVLL